MTKIRIEDLPVFDAADHLATPELQAAYIAAALEDGDPEEVLDAIALVARARGVAGPETDHPAFAVVLKALGDLGITLSAHPSRDKAA